MVISWAGESVNSFASLLGMNRAETFYQIKRGDYGISKRLATLIVNHFPQIDKLWLMTGEGHMLRNEGRITVVVPFYDEDVCNTIAVVGELIPATELVLPDMMGRCDFAMRHDGESTADRTTIVLLRRCVGEALAAGEYVALDGAEGKLIAIDGTGRCETAAGGAGHVPGTFAAETEDAVSLPEGFCSDSAVCEVVGRIVMRNMRQTAAGIK